jgi:tetratricopeptide (TPR) repeat protein
VSSFRLLSLKETSLIKHKQVAAAWNISSAMLTWQLFDPSSISARFGPAETSSRPGFEACPVPKAITQYNIFIGSPGGLIDERKKFRAQLDKCSLHHGSDKDVRFHPVGWEDTNGGVGRPQELINDDLRQCDYAVFVLHDRWGSPTGNGYASGIEEEWALAEELYKANKIRNIALFFKAVDPGKLGDPGDHLKPVLAFKKRIEEEKRYLFKEYGTLDEFADTLDGHLARWLREHDKAKTGLSLNDPIAASPPATDAKVAAPGFDYWIAEANENADAADYTAAFFCASKAIDAAKSDIEWAKATKSRGVTQFHLGKIDEAISAFAKIAERFSTASDADSRSWHANALFNKAVSLGALGRSDDEMAVYDDLLARFGAATELPLREQVAKALFNKGVTLGALGRSDDEIAVYDDLLTRFGAATELPLREPIAIALFNKGVTLGALGRGDDEMAVYDDLLARFGAATELPLRERVAKALINKGVTLGALGRGDDAIAVYDDLLARFGAATELPLREPVAKALFNKGVRLGALGRGDDAIAVYDDLLARFGAATELPLCEQVARALFNKGGHLGALGRGDDAMAVYDDLLARFGAATELPLCEQVAKALLNKGGHLGALGRGDAAIAVYDDLLARFGAATESPLRELVAEAIQAKSTLTKPRKSSQKRSRRS